MPRTRKLTLYDLIAALRYEGVSDSAYSIGEPFREGTQCLERTDKSWNVFEMDSGTRVRETTHRTEGEACKQLLERLLRDDRIRDGGSPERPLTGSVRIDWVEDAGQEDVPNFGWRLRLHKPLADSQLMTLLRDVADTVADDPPGRLGTPRIVVLYLSPEGWRYATYTSTGVADGRLSELPSGASPAEAQTQFEQQASEAEGREVAIDWMQDPNRTGYWVGAFDRASGQVTKP